MCSIECRRIFSVKSAKMRIWFCKNIAFLKTAHKNSRILSRSQTILRHHAICKGQSIVILLVQQYLFGFLYLFVLLYLKILFAPKGDPCFAFTDRMPHFCFCCSIAFARLLKNQPFFSREARKKRKQRLTHPKKRKAIMETAKNKKKHNKNSKKRKKSPLRKP